MSWITNFVRPKIQALMQKNQIPDNLWTKCQGCEHMLFQKDLIENLFVCHHCHYHFKMTIKDRLNLILDEYTTRPFPQVQQDPLKFKDIKKYSDRLKDYRSNTAQEDASLTAFGHIDSYAVVVWIMDFRFMGGSMGMGVGESFLQAIDLSIQTNSPFLAITSSGGARMQEGIFSLMQMPRTLIGVSWLKERKIPYITLLTDPTTGGVSASFAMVGDIALAEPGAIIGFAGARVIEETMRQKLPIGFQKSEFLHKHGMIDQIVHRHQLKKTLKTLLSILKNRVS